MSSGEESSFIENVVDDSSYENDRRHNNSMVEEEDTELKRVEDQIRMRLQKDIRTERRVSDMQGQMIRLGNNIKILEQMLNVK